MVKRISRRSVVSWLIFLLIVILAVPTMAFDARSGANVTIGSGEVVNSDLYLSGTNINIDGTVNGDVFALGQTININGTVNGGITIAGQTITVNGKVSTGARLAGQTVNIGGNIGRDLVVAASDVLVSGTAVIGGDLNVYSNANLINGRINGNVTGTANNMTINGGIGKNVIITVTTLTINSTANLGGNLTYTSPNKANIQSGATVAGTTNQIVPPTPSERDRGRGRGLLAVILGAIALRVFGFLAIFVVALVIIFVAMRRLKQLALAIQYHPAQCLGWGALIFFVTPIAAFIVMFTVIGIPLGIISLVIWGILLYLSQIPVALIIGWLILSRSRDTPSHGFLIGALALGLLILYLVSSIPIFGWIMWLFVMLFGLGSLVTVLRVAPGKNVVT
jgi:hypothetical protein